MKLDVAAALKQPGQTFEATVEERLPDQAFAGRMVRFSGPVRLELQYSFDSKALTLTGLARFAIEAACARCDESFIEAMEIPLRERFVKGDGADEDSYAFEGDKIDLDAPALDNLFLHLPIQNVCREDCRGLCPICGCNLNTAQCDCEREGPLVSLKSLLDDKEV